jgi:imidazole glycerol phosphate synthase subunit HisF
MSKNAKNQNENEESGAEQTLLVGYVRKSNAGGAQKVSINTSAMADCSTYTTSDGQIYIPLVISLNALHKVLDGERSVTTVSQFVEN